MIEKLKACCSSEIINFRNLNGGKVCGGWRGDYC